MPYARVPSWMRNFHGSADSSPVQPPSRWSIGALLHEAAANVTARDGARTALALVFVLVFCAASLAEAFTVDDLVSRETDLDVRGGYVLIAEVTSSSGSSLDASACEGLATQDGVTAAGSVLSTSLERLEVLPGTRVRVISASPGLLRALRVSDTNATVVVGGALQDELGVAQGSLLRIVRASGGPFNLPVGDVARHGALLPGGDRAIVVVRPPTGSAELCYAAIEPANYARLRGGDLAGLGALAAGSVAVREFVPRGEARDLAVDYRDRVTRFAWATGAVVAGLCAGVLRRSRRRELSLYRALGADAAEVIALQLVELSLLTAGATAVAAIAFAVTSVASELSQPAVLHGLWSLILVVAGSLVVQLPGLARSAAARDVAGGLKET